MALLAADETAFVLVTSPRRDAVEEAEFFASRLADGEYAVDALVVNRMHVQYCDIDPATLRARGDELAAHDGEAATRLAARYTNLADFEDVALRERAELSGLENRIGDASVAHVPELGHDVHDFTALRAVAEHLMSVG
jgi:anion-transporting  ArsA/GET3 family ATPase